MLNALRGANSRFPVIPFGIGQGDSLLMVALPTTRCAACGHHYFLTSNATLAIAGIDEYTLAAAGSRLWLLLGIPVQLDLITLLTPAGRGAIIAQLTTPFFVMH